MDSVGGAFHFCFQFFDARGLWAGILKATVAALHQSTAKRKHELLGWVRTIFFDDIGELIVA